MYSTSSPSCFSTENEKYRKIEPSVLVSVAATILVATSKTVAIERMVVTVQLLAASVVT